MADQENTEKFYPTSEYVTYLWIYRLMGLAPAKFIDWFKSFGLLSLFVSGIVHYVIYIYLREINGYERVDVMEATHWLTMCSGVGTMAITQILLRKRFEEIDKIVKDGVYDYGEDFSEEMLRARQDGNEFLRKVARLLWFCLYTGINASLTKRTIFGRKDNQFENVIYKGWWPFEINSWFRYSVTLLYHTSLAYTVGCTAFFTVMTFFAASCQFCAQLKVFELGMKSAIAEKNEEITLRKLKKCVQHYNQIKKLYGLMETFFGNSLGPIPIFMVFLICTFLYDITDPDVKVGGNVLVFVPEVGLVIISSYFGQQITDFAHEIGNEVYFTEWYTKSVRVKKHLLLIMVGMHKPMSIKGFGVFPFNMEGLNEVLKAGYSYFNALNAARETPQ